MNQTKQLNSVYELKNHYSTDVFVEQKSKEKDSWELISKTIDATVFIVDMQDGVVCHDEPEPPAAAAKMEAFYTYIQQAVHLNRGILNQCENDLIIAVFCTSDRQNKDHAQRATTVAFEVMEQLMMLNRWRTAHELPPVHIGLGVNSGEMIIGDQSKSKWSQLTIQGQTVDVAARFSFLNRTTPIHTVFMGYNTVQEIQNENGWVIEPLRSVVEVNETAVSVYALLYP